VITVDHLINVFLFQTPVLPASLPFTLLSTYYSFGSSVLTVRGSCPKDTYIGPVGGLGSGPR
jgi:hypothetical protein